MVSPILGQQLARRLCEVFGLPPHQIRSLQLNMDPEDAVMLHVELYVDEAQAEELLKEFRSYILCERVVTGYK